MNTNKIKQRKILKIKIKKLEDEIIRLRYSNYDEYTIETKEERDTIEEKKETLHNYEMDLVDTYQIFKNKNNYTKQKIGVYPDSNWN